MIREKMICKMEKINWPYALNDENDVLQEFQDRICRTARLRSSLISYSNLVAGVKFKFSNVNNGDEFYIDVHNWQGLHRKIVGDCLGYISYVSYRDFNFIASAIVAGLIDNKPSDIFFEWMNSLGAIKNMNKESIDSFWVSEVKKVVDWYALNPQGFKVMSFS